MFLDRNDVFDTPAMRYYKLQREFHARYLSPKAWNNEYGSREYVEAYHDLLVQGLSE